MSDNDITLSMYAPHLAEDELRYELDIRLPMGVLEGDEERANHERLTARLLRDSLEQRSATAWLKPMTAIEFDEELRLCQSKVIQMEDKINTELSGSELAQACTTIDIMDMWKELASRSVHVSDRMSRLYLSEHYNEAQHGAQLNALHQRVQSIQQTIRQEIEDRSGAIRRPPAQTAPTDQTDTRAADDEKWQGIELACTKIVELHTQVDQLKASVPAYDNKLLERLGQLSKHLRECGDYIRQESAWLAARPELKGQTYTALMYEKTDRQWLTDEFMACEREVNRMRAQSLTQHTPSQEEWNETIREIEELNRIEDERMQNRGDSQAQSARQAELEAIEEERRQTLELTSKRAKRYHNEIERIRAERSEVENESRMRELVKELQKTGEMILDLRVALTDEANFRRRATNLAVEVKADIDWLQTQLIRIQEERLRPTRPSKPEANSTFNENALAAEQARAFANLSLSLGNPQQRPINNGTANLNAITTNRASLPMTRTVNQNGNRIEQITGQPPLYGNAPRTANPSPLDISNGVTLNDIRPPVTQNNQNQNAHVQFANIEPINGTPRRPTENGIGQDEQRNWQQRPLSNEAARNRDEVVGQNRYDTEYRDQRLRRRQRRSRTPERPRQINIYHPSTPMPPNTSRIVESSDEDEDPFGPEMNVGQKQQYLSRLLGHRRFDGDGISNNKQSISLDEFISHVRHSKHSTGWRDRTVLSMIASSVTGHAYKWWMNNNEDIRTLDDLEVEMRRRFTNKSMDRAAQLADLVGRKQGEDECLLEYFEDMRYRAKQMYPPEPDANLIKIIEDNANPACRAVLMPRQFATVKDMANYAIHAAGLNLNKRRTEPQAIRKPAFHRSKHVNVTEVDTIEGEQEVNEGEENEPDMAEIILDAIQSHPKLKSYFRTGNKYPNNHSKSSGGREKSGTPIQQANVPTPTYAPQSQHYQQFAQPQQQQVNATIPQAHQPLYPSNTSTAAYSQPVQSYQVAQASPPQQVSAMAPQSYQAPYQTNVVPQQVQTQPPSISQAYYETIRCFGCNTPGVYKRDCVNCNKTMAGQQPKNVNAALTSTRQ